jgi:lysophospholipase L1-like esterase
MKKAVQLLIGVGVLLLIDAVLPRATWMPPALVTKNTFDARWWPSTPPAPAATLVVDDLSDDEDEPAPKVIPTPPPPPVVVAETKGQPTVVVAMAPAKPAPVAKAPRKTKPVQVEALPNSFVAPAIAGWDDFRARLAELEEGKRSKVRVVQLGDSEIAGDWVSRTLRRQFGNRYGEGGLGFSLAMAPWPWYWREGYRHTEPNGFLVKSFVFGKSADGNYGPGGIGFDSTHKGASATIVVEDPPEGGCEISFHYGTNPNGGDVDVFADAEKLERVSTVGPERLPAVKRYTLKECPEKLTATAATDAKVRIFGWSIESTKPGVVWSSLGVVSANAANLQHYSAAQLTQALQDLRPDLIVLGYGLNLVHTGQPPPSAERATFKAILSELRDGLKDARCLAISPYPIVVSQDGNLSASTAVSILARYQREAAEEVGCAFLDRERLSGGPEMGLKWLDSKPRLLSGDYVHLTEKGSERLGRQMARVLLDAKPETL